jgi:hypothetical protein
MVEESLTETYERVRDALLDLVNDTPRPRTHQADPGD